MIKEYFLFSPILDNYCSVSKDSYQKESGWLSMLHSSFFNFNNGYIWVDPDKSDPDFITISMHFPGDEDDELDTDAVLRMSKKNYEYIAKQFEIVNEQKPKHFILSYGDNGWIDLEIKNELLEQDLQNIDQEKYTKLQAR